MRAIGVPLRVGVAATMLVAFALDGPALGTILEAPNRVVAVGDVHGAYDDFVALLEASDIIGADLGWAGGNTILVQTGDLMDRGSKVRAVLDLMMVLEAQAPGDGGRVISLLGNHEVSNLIGYLDYRSTPAETYREIFASFADDKSEKRRRRALRRWDSWLERYPNCAQQSEEEWLELHPPGFVEYFDALGPDGGYGRWLRSRDITVRIDGAVFVHGGLSPELIELGIDSLEEINRRIREELKQFDDDRSYLGRLGIWLPFFTLKELVCGLDWELHYQKLAAANGRPASYTARLQEIRQRLPGASWLSINPQGPLWFRGFAHWDEEEGPEGVAIVSTLFGAERFVVGHTPQKGKIVRRFDDTVFLIDTAMVFGPEAGGAPAALELRADGVSTIYLNEVAGGATSEPPPARPARVWLDADDNPLPFQTVEEIAEFLRSAETTEVAEIPLGVTKPLRLVLERDGVRSKAAFRHYHEISTLKRTSKLVIRFFRDSYRNEVAAFELSRLLGMTSVPPTVMRKVNSQQGSVQKWVENTMMERDRLRNGIEPPDSVRRVRFARQLHDMRVFDNLIGNIDRNQGNILIDDDWNVWLIDHTRAFSRDSRLPAPEQIRRCSAVLWTAIKELDEQEASELLAKYLDKTEVKGFHERRRKLIALIDGLIEERGEARVLFRFSSPEDTAFPPEAEFQIPAAAIEVDPQ